MRPRPVLTLLVRARELEKTLLIVRRCCKLKTDRAAILREATGQRQRGKARCVEGARETKQTAAELFAVIERPVADARRCRDGGGRHQHVYFLKGLPESAHDRAPHTRRGEVVRRRDQKAEPQELESVRAVFLRTRANVVFVEGRRLRERDRVPARRLELDLRYVHFDELHPEALELRNGGAHGSFDLRGKVIEKVAFVDPEHERSWRVLKLMQGTAREHFVE